MSSQISEGNALRIVRYFLEMFPWYYGLSSESQRALPSTDTEFSSTDAKAAGVIYFFHLLRRTARDSVDTERNSRFSLLQREI